MERQLLLLGLLRRQKMHGYQLHEFINDTMASCIDLKKPTAYYLLNKIAEAGWVVEMEEQDGGRPVRRVYHLTAEGEAAFQRLLRENLAAHHDAQFGGDVGIAFLDELEPGEALALLARRRAALAEKLAAVQQAPDHKGTLQLVIEHQVRHLAAELDWTDEIMARLEEKHGQSDHEARLYYP